jgi:protein required for attachment to host cells
MNTTWIVVAESARARVFSRAGKRGSLREIADLSHPESRLHDTELSSDVPGRSFDSHGQGRHGMEQSTDPQDREAQAFAGEIAQHVEHGRREGSFEALVLVAPPKFLGLLRSELNKLTRDRVVAEINKNLVEADQKTIEHQLSEAIP